MKLATVVILAMSAAAPLALHAQAYPAKPVRLVVPYAPGGGSDLMARLLGERARETLGQSFVVENRAGASGNVGLEYAAKSAPDGYTLVINPNSISITLPLFGSSTDAVRDFTPVIMVSQAPIVLGGNASLPVGTIKEFVAYVRANPGKLSYSHCGSGGLQQIAMESLKQAAKIDLTHIPYKGCGPPIPDNLSGQVPFFASVMNSVAGHLKSGKLKVYAVANASRSSLLPDVPTVAESGFPGFAVDNWIGIFGPAGIPGDIVSRLNGAFNDALKRPEIRDKMTALMIEPVGGSAEQLAGAVKADAPRYARIIKDAGIKPD